jgi:hypothetical protein
MDQLTPATDTLPYVMSNMNYLAPMVGRPGGYTYDPPPGIPRSNASHEPHKVAIKSLRPIQTQVSLDREGFAVLPHTSATRDFFDADEVKTHYYPEIETLLKAATGASQVRVFDATTRRHVAGSDGDPASMPNQPVRRVHVDHTPISAPDRVRHFFGAEATRLLQHRYQIINVWRPTNGPVLDAPLAVADARSVGPADLIATDIIYPDRTGEIYSVVYNPAHRWFYLPQMRNDEVLLIKCFDSALDGTARFTPHSSFIDPTTPPNAPLRESIEIRALLFHAPATG